MAGMLVVGIGMGAEKLGKKISEKRDKRKEKKHAAEQEAIYGTAGPSSSARAVEDRTEKKYDEARREQQYDGRRRGVSEERISEEEPPPRYEDVVRQDARQ